MVDREEAVQGEVKISQLGRDAVGHFIRGNS